ncbi:MAG: hypothetical protein HC814_07155, partial [Rhodobacteraceae bacterium]|nr:hypothetical protein [Paracoccaceae bacterium]
MRQVEEPAAMAAFRQAMIDARWHAELDQWVARHPGEARSAVDRDLEVLLGLRDNSGDVVFIANTENEIHRALDI